MKPQRLLRTSLAAAALFPAFLACGANTIIDFESPLPGGLTPLPAIEGTPIPQQSLVADNYASLGVLMPVSALVDLGSGIAPSGINGIMSARPITGDPGFEISSAFGLVFLFVSPSDPNVRAATDFFSITPVFLSDQHRPIRVVFYSVDGNLVGSQLVEPTAGTPIVVSTTTPMGLIIVAPTAGSVAFDTLEFGALTPVPEPAITMLFALGACGVFIVKRWIGNGEAAS